MLLTLSVVGWLPFTGDYGIKTVEAATSQTFTTSGSWLAPDGTSTITVEAWGGGGAGGGRGASSGQSGGGGGGAYASATITVTPGNTYNYTVGATAVGGAADGANGNPSQWDAGTQVLAAGGSGGLGTTTGGAGGTVAASVGTVRYAGGNGANAVSTLSGGGGGGAGSTGNGGNASGGTGGTGTTVGGGSGGAGVSNANGNPGNTAGGGGSGARRTNGNRSGGDGAAGQIKITYTVISVTVADGIVTYGSVPTGGSQNTTSSGVNDTQVATNSGDSAEDFNIRGTNSANWTLASIAGVEQYVHSFCKTGTGSPDPCDASPTWTPLTTSYQSLALNVLASGSQSFDLRIKPPDTTAITSSQSVDVTIQAVAH